MELTELSLATRQRSVIHQKSINCYSSSSESDGFSSRKRKYFADHHHHRQQQQYFLKSGIGSVEPNQTSVDLQAKDPLPLDWEQCLDLESGKMYYLNRKTLKKSWTWPKDQKLDLELNMTKSDQYNNTSLDHRSINIHQMSTANAASTNMVALACSNCHLLVILSKSSPCCPNCKFVHSLRTQPQTVSQVKTHSTLSLLI